MIKIIIKNQFKKGTKAKKKTIKRIRINLTEKINKMMRDEIEFFFKK